MHPEEKKEEIRGFYSSLLVSFVTAAIIIFAAVLKFSYPPPPSEHPKPENTPGTIEIPLQSKIFSEPDSESRSASEQQTSQDGMRKIEKQISPAFSLKGMELYRSGQYDAAADAWERILRSPEHRQDFTIQLLLACKRETITKAFSNSGETESLFYIKSRYKDMTCYKLCMGLYRNRDEAEVGRSNVPEYFSGIGNRPVIIPVSKLFEGATAR